MGREALQRRSKQKENLEKRKCKGNAKEQKWDIETHRKNVSEGTG